MSSRARRLHALAVHEYRAAARSRVLVALTTLLAVATIASVYVASVAHRSQVADYVAYRNAATASGIERVAPSPLAPLALLRGAFEYLQIVGAVIAIALGYLTITRERTSRTFVLLRSRPVSAGDLATGTLVGAAGVLATLVGATAVVAVMCVGVIGHDWISAGEAMQLLVAYAVSVGYLIGFYSLGVWCAARSRNPANGLIVALCIWLLFVLVTPQIGDTLDADNQIPGGLFHALGLNRADETSILTHFSFYETLRTRIEWISFSQHYQRFVFAMTDVKERYRVLTFGGLMARVWTDLAWATVVPALLVGAQRRAFRKSPTTGDHP